METENFNILSADNPLIDPKDDRLGYASFAKNLAESLCLMTSSEGLVLAVYGSWGSGKSTLLNFVIYNLEQKPNNEQPIIVRFNPWWFSGEEALTKQFFNQLQAVLSNKLKSGAKKLSKNIANFADTISEAPLPYAKSGKVVSRLLGQGKDVYQLKKEIEKVLLKQHKRILILIDDIDRLTAEEIRQLFRVIKAVANFPNVIYLLLFDKEVVIKALEEAQGIPGEDYLEKIVQVPFELPTLDKSSLQRLLFERLDAIITETSEELFDQTYWGNVFFKGIESFITKPRDIVRLANTLSVTYPAVQGEVNPVDFIAIESLRVFCPKLYDIIRNNPRVFAGNTDARGINSDSVDAIKPLLEEWILQLKEGKKEPVKNLLKRIFPKLQAIWGDGYHQSILHGANWESSWRKQLRVCSLERFPIYFRLALPEGDFSNIEMQSILTLVSDANAFGKKLLELANQIRPDGTTRVRTFLERLEDYTKEDISSESIPSIVQAFFDVGDKLLRPEDQNRGMFDFGNDMRIGRILYQLLSRMNQTDIFKLLKEAVEKGKALSIIVRQLNFLGIQQGKYGEDRAKPKHEWFVSAEHLKELEEITLKKIQEAAQQNTLMSVPNLLSILYFWEKRIIELCQPLQILIARFRLNLVFFDLWFFVILYRTQVKQWVKEVIKTDEGLINFLEKFLQKTFSHSASNLVSTKSYRIDLEQLEPFLDSSSIIGRVRNLATNNQTQLTEEQAKAVEQFIREYEMRQQGKDPN